MKTKGGMYQNVQKVSRKRVIGCQRRFECLRVVGRVVGTITVGASDIRRNFYYATIHVNLLFSQSGKIESNILKMWQNITSSLTVSSQKW